MNARHELIAVDTNVMVEAHIDVADAHAISREAVSRLLAAQRLALSLIVLSEFVHIATDGRRFPEAAMPMDSALATADLYLKAANVELLAVDARCLKTAMELMTHHSLGRKRINDTTIAAQLLGASVSTLVTRDRSGFEPFDFIRPVTPEEFLAANE